MSNGHPDDMPPDWGQRPQDSYQEPPRRQQQQQPAQSATTALAIANDWRTDQGLVTLEDMLPPGLDAKRMLAAWAGAFADNPQLEACTPESKLRTMMDCARIGLWPGPAGHVSIVSYRDNDRGTVEAQAQVGRQGVVALLKREAGVSHVDSNYIGANEEHVIIGGSAPKLEVQHRAFDRGQPVAWYAVAHFADGSPSMFELMDEETMRSFRDRYRSDKRKKSGPWTTEYGEMARKTVVKRVAKHVGTGDVLAYALRLDPTTELPREKPQRDYPDTRQGRIQRRLER
jgi:recombination protein RecT